MILDSTNATSQLGNDSRFVSHLAFTLTHRHPGVEIAFLVDALYQRILFATSEIHGLRPFSAVLNLIQGIYDAEPAMARKILRNRIFTTSGQSARDAGAVKVAAKSITWNIKPQESSEMRDVLLRHLPLQWVQLRESTPPKNLSGSPLRLERTDVLRPPHEYFRLTHRLSRIIKREGGALYRMARPVAAILVSDSGEILCASVNTNSQNRTRHAEMNLIQRYFLDTGSLIPPGAKIYTSLKPCKMCAGIIHDCAADPSSLQVLYWEDDPGPMAQNTILEAKGLQSGPYAESPSLAPTSALASAGASMVTEPDFHNSSEFFS